MIYVKVNDTKYPATINGHIKDNEWDNRESKTIILSMTYEEVKTLFADNTSWYIIVEDEIQKKNADGTSALDENNQPIMETVEEVYDNSKFSMSGPITDNRDGTCTIKMGKPTDLENAYAMLIGGTN